MRTMGGGKCIAEYCQNKTAFGYCKTTVCINPMYSNIGTAQYGQGAQKVVVTNADRIRSTTDEETDEELAKVLVRIGCRGLPDELCVQNDSCRACWLNWLKQEAE